MAAKALFGKNAKAEYKRYNDVVTEADFASEKIVADAIRKEFPTHGILSEEGDNKNATSDYCWYVDPVDGTNNFFMGIPLWGVSFALYKGNEGIAGVMYFPMLNELYYAEKGKGAYLNGKRIRVSGKKKTKEALFVLDDAAAFSQMGSENASEITKNFFATRVFGSACYTYGLVARGTASACFHAHLKPGDFAAGKIIIEEAGGKVEDLENREFDVRKTTKILASNKSLHGGIKKVLGI